MHNTLAALLLVGLSSSMLVSALFNYHMKRQNGPPHYSSKLSQCQEDLISCAGGLMHYQVGSEAEIVQKIKTTGIRKLCEELNEAMECGVGAVMNDACEALPDNMKDYLMKTFHLVNYVCSKRDEVERHWDCLFAIQAGNALEICLSDISSNDDDDDDDCNPRKFLGCAKRAADATNVCQDDVMDLITDVAYQAVAVSCPDMLSVRQKFMNLLLKK